jgi:transcriptional regulator with XRE-family HTH domain
MCPPEGGKKPRKPYRTRGRARSENFNVMQWLDQERQRQGMSLRDVARKMGPGYRNASRIGQYFRQQIVAGPDVLVRLAKAVNVSPIDALWNARHFDAIFERLLKLYCLGWSWARHDRVDVRPDDGADFMMRHIQAPPPVGSDLRDPPADIAHRYHAGRLLNDVGAFRAPALPKPMACAILLAVGLFPRRGDEICDEMREFCHQLSLIVEDMMPQAELARIPPQNITPMRRPLKAAEEVLKYRFYGVERYAIVGEYVNKWCDFISYWYAHYARLVMYCQGGVLNIADQDNDLWKYLHVEPPSAEELRIEPEN